MEVPADLPEEVDPQLWFECRHHSGWKDYLVPSPWHTFPGRMSAWCSARDVTFRVSKSELPSDMPAATRYWVEGFLAGNVPHQPDSDDDKAMSAWNQLAELFLATGEWPADLAMEQHRRWLDDAEILGQIGAVLSDLQLPVVRVRLPAALANEAVAAWNRDDDGPLDYESTWQRDNRHRAADLALIGLAIQTGSTQDGREVVVDVSADVVVAAIRAAED